MYPEFNAERTGLVRCDHCKTLLRVKYSVIKFGDGIIDKEAGKIQHLIPGAYYYCSHYCLEGSPLIATDRNKIPSLEILKMLLRHEPAWAERAILCLTGSHPHVKQLLMDPSHRGKLEAMASRLDERERPHPGEIGHGAFAHLMDIILPLYAENLLDIAIDNRDKQLKIGKYHPNCTGQSP